MSTMHVIVYMYICFSLFCAIATKKQDPLEFLKQEKNVYSSKVKCPSSLKELRHFWLISKNAKAIAACVLGYLESNPKSGYWWSVLGSVYQNSLGKTRQAAICFNEASTFRGRYDQDIKEMSFLGPFVIGKMELDGDPMEAFGGIHNVSKYRYSSSQHYFSELTSKGKVSWKTVKPSNNNYKITPDVPWNQLVNNLGSMGIAEWQGWAVGEFTINDKNVNIVIQCLGVHTVFIDDTPLTGDVYHRERFWFTKPLSQGVHTLYIRIRTKVSASFKCSLRSLKSSEQIEVLSPHFLPDIHDGFLFGHHVVLPIANYNSKKWLKIIQVRVSDQSSGQKITSSLVKEISIAPGQILPIPIELSVEDKDRRLENSCSTITLQLKFHTSEGSLRSSFDLRCREKEESFLFTFLDHDGSVQHGAAIEPRGSCADDPMCPVLLTLHGTTVPPQNQADSYKHMVKDKFVFGLQNAWVLAPTRHGAHNWEGPGLLTAITSLERLAELTHRYSWIKQKIDAHQVLFSGHSMGGHGAWMLASHYPDRGLALIPLAGWIKKEEYGDSNLFFKFDMATSHVDPAVKAVLEACVVENEVDKHVTNLKGMDILSRVGSDDQTVHPFFSRRMLRLTKELNINISYVELPGKEHWWWDTWETNDGGAVNDKQLRNFMEYVASKTAGNCGSSSFSSSSSSDDNVNDETHFDCLQSTNKYTSQGLSFILTTYNPALGEGKKGFHILQQKTPFRQSRLSVTASNDIFVINTTNVLSFEINTQVWKDIHLNNLLIDGNTLNIESSQKKISLCTQNAAQWFVCNVQESKSRTALSYGPAKRIAEKQFLIVVDPDPLHSQSLLEMAVYISNLFFLTSDTMAVIKLLDDVTKTDIETNNIVLLTLSPRSKDDIFMYPKDLNFLESSVKLRDCLFADPRTGILSLASNIYNPAGLAMLLTGNSLEGLRDVVSLATPTIPPMTRSPFTNLIPDFVVTGPEFGWKGPGGYLCTGFWGNSWEFRSDTSSCVC